MRPYKIMFSVPVHERPEVVLDQICNFAHFNPDCAIVLHISQTFDERSDVMKISDFWERLKSFGNV